MDAEPQLSDDSIRLHNDPSLELSDIYDSYDSFMEEESDDDEFDFDFDENTEEDSDRIIKSLDVSLMNLHLETYQGLTDEEKISFVEQFDGLELFDVACQLNRELCLVETENYYLKEFLEENDPIVLENLEKKRLEFGSGDFFDTYSMGDEGESDTRLSSIRMSFSIRKTTELELNYATRASFAEKSIQSVEKRINESKVEAMKHFKMVGSQIEEWKQTDEELEGTIENFKLCFLRDDEDKQFLARATETAVCLKFRKYITSWIKDGRSLTSLLHLNVREVQNACSKQQLDVTKKYDLRTCIHAIDVDLLVIKKKELLEELKSKTTQVSHFKIIAGYASINMAESLHENDLLEQSIKELNNRLKVGKVRVDKLRRVVATSEFINKQMKDNIDFSEKRIRIFKAPSLNTYVELKNELYALKKTAKMLKRRFKIKEMQYKNVLSKLRSKVILTVLRRKSKKLYI